MYKPPNVKDHIFEDTFCKLLDKIFSVSPNVILTGDLNFNMNHENALKSICNVYGLKNKIVGNTCFKENHATAIDVFLVTDMRVFGCCLNVDISTSDFHNIIGCSLKTNKPKPNKKIIQYRSFKHFDEDKFHKDLKELPIHSVICSGDVDHQLSLFYTMYSDVVDKHIPLKRKTINKSPAPFMNGVLRKAIYVKCTLRNRYYKNRSTENWHRYRSQRNLVTKLRKQSIRGYFKKKCEGDVNRNDFWKTIKPFISNKNCVQGDNIILREGSDIVTDQQEVCNVFNDFFTNVATNIGFQDMIPTDISKDNLVQHVMDKHAQHPGVIHIQECISNNTFAFHHITDDDVLKILNNIDIKKQRGMITCHHELSK